MSGNPVSPCQLAIEHMVRSNIQQMRAEINRSVQELEFKFGTIETRNALVEALIQSKIAG